MRILVTGKDGQVGWELQRTLSPLGEVIAYGRAQLDLANADQLRECVRAVQPQWIVNAAAYTAVDRAEQEESLALAINGQAPGVLAEEAQRLDAGMIHFSTDYVFAGDKASPYVETDPTSPLSAYGRSKLEGERRIEAVGGRHWTFRTSWVYAARGKNFLLTMLKLANQRPRLRVVADQIGAPTWSRMIAEGVALFVMRQTARADSPSGIYHLTAGGQTSWHGFAEHIIRGGAERGLCPMVPVDAIATTDYPTPARRPANSVLGSGRLQQTLGLQLPHWQQSLSLCLDELVRSAG
jgi:dTDP-4-dehydrorhamnose reductase